MERKSEPRTVLVTGANRGIGAALARAYAGGGYLVFLGSRREEAALPVRDAILQAGGRAEIVALDVDDAESVRRAAAALEGRQAPDVLVNNAGILRLDLFDRQPWEEIEALVRTNLLGVLRVTRAVLPGMLRRGRGQIVNNGSIASMGLPVYAAYAATKAAVTTFSTSLRRELEGAGIRVCVLETPRVDTEMGAYATGRIRERGWFRFGAGGKRTLDADGFARIAFRRLERGNRSVTAREGHLVLRLQRFLPRLVDLAVRMAFRRRPPL